MPPRIQRVTSSCSIPAHTQSTVTARPRPRHQTLPQCQSQSQSQGQGRAFTTTPAAQTRLRGQMFEWLNSEGRRLRYHEPGVPKYVSNVKELGRENPQTQQLSQRPFPLNPNFVSEPILGEDMRREIYRRVVEEKKSIRVVSIELRVDMRRVAAVVRLMELENAWKKQGELSANEKQGNQLALPYARAVHEMLPKTTYSDNPAYQRRHESINDLPVHRQTDPQIFYPVSESRPFTRTDAGRVFSGAPRLLNHESSDPSQSTANPSKKHHIERVGKGADETQVLQPADARIPHPYLVSHERDRLDRPDERNANIKRFAQRLVAEDEADAKRRETAQRRQAESMDRVVPQDSRFEFRVSDVVVSKETTGKDGRGTRAPGRRYGVPSDDRKKGQVKIPTSVKV